MIINFHLDLINHLIYQVIMEILELFLLQPIQKVNYKWK